MNSKWFSEAKSAEEKEEIKQLVHLSSRVLDILRHIVDSKMDASVTQMHSKARYDNPSWAESTADEIGYQRALTEIKHLLEV